MLTVVQGKEKYHCTIDDTTSVADVKARLESATGVPAKGQRLLVKGKERDASVVLSSIGVKAGSKIMLLFTKEYQAKTFSKATVLNKEAPDNDVRPQFMRLLAKGKEVSDGSRIEEIMTTPHGTLEMLMLFKYGYHMQVEGSVWLKQRQEELDGLKSKLERMENSLDHRGGDLAEFLVQLTKVGEVVERYLESVDHVTVNESLLPEMKRLKEELLAADQKVKELNSRVPLV
ncbi:hypothetical protein Pmar_PMAR010134 [Perkinsus marinus ATCC 50983]|uniref:Ubiquitin-like domain-containing protein n=1 Tax=Perkinsus marinus (strain ATCC 50983 / TXsc) TaxID=423536 RepID=C5K4X8_PERM5|nr:hypothetical protein Pmar_PMAR010134 [Perkinsus marinus ATCC 50983]EER20400.1 hypothetical protein Pmar_PMAR010134 [Perkinsus marinus ATCC 50983]|eukprot:XP_002788604.1 hypothetical protein Pmar_PMAR010134 [Perkinsus marinus ATCC 50983]